MQAKCGGAVGKLCLLLLGIGTLIHIISNLALYSDDLDLGKISLIRGKYPVALQRRQNDTLDFAKNVASKSFSENKLLDDENTTEIKLQKMDHDQREIIAKFPALFDRSSGWNGTSTEDGITFCNNRVGSKSSVCSWNAYCTNGKPLGGILQGSNMSYWAPIASKSQSVWVGVGSSNSCQQRGNLDESDMAKVDVILCCQIVGGEEVMTNILGVASLGNHSSYEAECRRECHVSTTSHSTITTPQQYCLFQCKSMHNHQAMHNVAHFFATLPSKQKELTNQNRKCLERCQLLLKNGTSEGEASISIFPPSNTLTHCTCRCWWMYRSNAITRLTDNVQPQKHGSSSKVADTEVGLCSDISDNIHSEVCKSVAHRQKPKVNLILSSKDWVEETYGLGVRDCAASQCYVFSGATHTKSSHLFIGTGHTKKMNTSQVNVFVQENGAVGKGALPNGMDWFVSRDRVGTKPWIQYSHQYLMCDLCDKYAEEVLPNSERSWDRSLVVETLEPCMADLFKRHTLPAPHDLPLINPSLGFDGLFITNYTPLKGRREAVIKRVWDQFGFDPIIVSDFDREALSDDDMKCVGNTTGQTSYLGNIISPGQYSLTMKHHAIYYYMVQHELNNVLVMEDDGSFVHSDWTSKNSQFQEVIQNVPPDYDILILCGAEGKYIQLL